MKSLLIVILFMIIFINIAAQDNIQSEYYTSLKYNGFLFEADRKGFFGEGFLKITNPKGKVKTYKMGTIELLQEIDLDKDGKTEVIVGDYSGGAHCCYTYRIFYFYKNRLKTSNVVETGHCPIEPKDINEDGIIELVTCNSYYAYVYASYIGSVLPARIYIYNKNTIKENTSSYKDYLRSYLVDEYERLDRTIYIDFSGRINCSENEFEEDSMWGENEKMNNLRAKIASVFTLKYFVDGEDAAIKFLKNVYTCKSTYDEFESSLLDLIDTYK